MRNTCTLSLLTAIALIAGAPICKGAARAEILPMSDLDLATMEVANAKLLREQQSMNATPWITPSTSNGSTASNMSDNAPCGSVSIGNNQSSQNGVNSIVPSQTTVIVTGDVYNTANCNR